MSEYPKFLPRLDADGKETDEGAIVVQNAEEEAAALKAGHVARKSVQPAGLPSAPGAAPIEYLEFPKHVYQGEGEERISRVVKDAAEEAAAADEGFAALGGPAADPADAADEVENAFGDLSAKDAIEAIKASDDVAVLHAAQGSESRKTVLAAIDARLADLA